MAGQSAWQVLKGCRWQLRMGMNGPYGLDFGAVMQVGQALGADTALLADILPQIETVVLLALKGEDQNSEAED